MTTDEKNPANYDVVSIPELEVVMVPPNEEDYDESEDSYYDDHCYDFYLFKELLDKYIAAGYTIGKPKNVDLKTAYHESLVINYVKDLTLTREFLDGDYLVVFK